MRSEEDRKKAFLTVLAHELRNPLATIMSAVELIQAQGISAKETPDLLSVVDDRVRAMAAVLDKLLEGSRMSTDTFILEKGTVPAQRISKPLETTAPHADTLRVLVVDDNVTAADSLGQLLTLRGYHVEVAHDGAHALTIARIFLPQAAILDIAMPTMDGYELAGLLRREKFSCVYIALTGFGQAHDKQKAFDAGFHYHLTKPTGVKDIQQILQQIDQKIKK